MLPVWLLEVILPLNLAELGFGLGYRVTAERCHGLVLGPTTRELLVVRLEDGLGRTRGLGRGPPPPWPG